VIKTEQEYKRTKQMVEAEKAAIQDQINKLKEKGFSDNEIKNLMAAGMAIHEQKKWEVELYERIKRGDFSGIEHDLGKMLIAFRIYRGMTQRDLAKKLGVSPAQVSMDERNEYHGISVSKLERVMKALGVKAYFKPVEKQGTEPVFDLENNLVTN